jgi:PAS domain S-box-containing protein
MVNPLQYISEAILSAPNIGVSIADAREPDMPLVYVNRGFENLTGYAAHEVLGKNCRFLQGAYTDQPSAREVGKALDEQRPVTAVLKNYRKSGEEFYNHLHLYPLFDESGTLTHFVGIQTDITGSHHKEEVHRLEQKVAALERTVQQRTDELQEFVRELQGELNIQKRLEAELREANALLETKVEERTQELRIALEKQKALGEIRSRFVMTVSHEFRTPLSGIALAVGLLKKYNDQFSYEQRVEQLDNIRQAVEHLKGLLDEVMFISKADANKLEFVPKHFDICQLCRGVIAQIQRIDGDKHVFEFYSSAEPCNVEADEKLMRSALTNLIGNAAKYSPHHSKVRITLLPDDEILRINVQDEGIGILPEDLVNLFEPFHRGANAQKIEGTGLGLVIVKGIAERHGGSIEVESEVGKGTLFTFTIPRLQPILSE